MEKSDDTSFDSSTVNSKRMFEYNIPADDANTVRPRPLKSCLPCDSNVSRTLSVVADETCGRSANDQRRRLKSRSSPFGIDVYSECRSLSSSGSSRFKITNRVGAIPIALAELPSDWSLRGVLAPSVTILCTYDLVEPFSKLVRLYTPNHSEPCEYSLFQAGFYEARPGDEFIKCKADGRDTVHVVLEYHHQCPAYSNMPRFLHFMDYAFGNERWWRYRIIDEDRMVPDSNEYAHEWEPRSSNLTKSQSRSSNGTHKAPSDSPALEAHVAVLMEKIRFLEVGKQIVEAELWIVQSENAVLKAEEAAWQLRRAKLVDRAKDLKRRNVEANSENELLVSKLTLQGPLLQVGIKIRKRNFVKRNKMGGSMAKGIRDAGNAAAHDDDSETDESLFALGHPVANNEAMYKDLFRGLYGRDPVVTHGGDEAQGQNSGGSKPNSKIFKQTGTKHGLDVSEDEMEEIEIINIPKSKNEKGGVAGAKKAKVEGVVDVDVIK
jgi:hypothetical protein